MSTGASGIARRVPATSVFVDGRAAQAHGLGATPAATAATVTAMPALPLAAPDLARPVASSPERGALRARLVADDRATTALAGQSRLEAICSSLATQLLSHDVQPTVLATLGRTRYSGAGQVREYAIGHGSAWAVAGCYLSASRPFLLDGGPGAPATGSFEGLSVTRYATTLRYPWQGPVPTVLEGAPRSALVLDHPPSAMRVRGVLHGMPVGDHERHAVGAGTWYVRDVDTTITLHDTGDGLVLRDLERDLVRAVVSLTTWWKR